MRGVHIENLDLNLLKALQVLLQERHISRAATRAHLSQSAMSRTLGRLRQALGDELLVRTAGGFELTPRARAIQGELDAILSRVEVLLRGGAFHPAGATGTIRVAATDYAFSVVLDEVCGQVSRQAPQLAMTIVPLSPQTFDDLERGQLDLALTPVAPPAPLRWQPLFAEDFVCLLAREHPVADDLVTVEHLRRYPHADVVVLPPGAMIVQRRLLEMGISQAPGLRVPYFSAAAEALPGTHLIAILPRRFAERHADDPRLRIAAAPAEFGPFTYGMTWHPRLDGDSVHTWLRTLLEVAGARRI